MLNRSRTGWRTGVLFSGVLLATALFGPVQAALVSHTGQFANDDEVQSFAVQFAGAGLFTARTWSYGGGVNAAGATVAAGGFAPLLTLTDALGEVLFSGAGSSTSSVCSAFGATAPADGSFCWDTGFTFDLPAGNYWLYLSQDGNSPASNNVITDGFGRTGSPDYTAQDYLGSTGSGLRFVQADTSQRSGQWAVDFTDPAASSPGQDVPEPSTLAAVALGLLLLRAQRVRRPSAI